MMKEEFEKIAGYEVSNEDYNNIIEPMYMATDLSKEEFVKVIDKKRFALKSVVKIKKDMKKAAERIKDTCTHFTDYQTRHELSELIEEYITRKNLTNCHYLVNEEEKQFSTCYYPVSIEIYNTDTYKTYEVITL